METDFVFVKISDISIINVYFDFKKIKKKYNITKRKDVLDIISKVIDKVDPMLCKDVARYHRDGYFGIMVWNDEGTRIITI